MNSVKKFVTSKSPTTVVTQCVGMVLDCGAEGEEMERAHRVLYSSGTCADALNP